MRIGPVPDGELPLGNLHIIDVGGIVGKAGWSTFANEY